jgi:cytochrome P450
MARPPLGPAVRPYTSYRVLTDPVGAFQGWTDRYGDTFLCRSANGDIVATADPAVIEAAMTAPTDKLAAFKPEILKDILGDAVITLDGHAHRRERRLLQPAFHGPRLAAFSQAIQDITRARVATWQPGETRVAADELLEITFDVITRVVFGAEDPDRVARYLAALRDLGGRLSPLLLFFGFMRRPWGGLSPWNGFVDARSRLRTLADEEVAQRRAAGTEGRHDVLSQLLEARYDDGASMPDDTVFAELLTLLFAGHETTTLALAQGMQLLALHPDVLQDLRDELTPLGGQPAAVLQAPLLDATCKEILRLGDVVTDFLRTAQAPLDLAGVEVLAGEHLCIMSSVLHRRPELYPEPHAFRPRRFLDRAATPFTFTPFGGGARRCLGAALAMQEMKLVLDVLVREARWTVGRRSGLVRRSATMAPDDGVRFTVQAT